MQAKDMPQLPSLDVQGLRHFRKRLETTKCYLEYGSGGSTIIAANTYSVPVIISVDSDKEWVDRVTAAIPSSEDTKVFVEYCDIGPVREWGNPINLDCVEHFWRYSFRPWETAGTGLFEPDLILIDGRFRVCAFLVTLLYSLEGAVIMFDDYFDRPHYFIAEQFCQLHARHGRMAEFVNTKKYSHVEICKVIARYATVYH